MWLNSSQVLSSSKQVIKFLQLCIYFCYSETVIVRVATGLVILKYLMVEVDKKVYDGTTSYLVTIHDCLFSKVLCL